MTNPDGQFLQATTAYREFADSEAEVSCTFAALPTNAAIALEVFVFESISQDLHCHRLCARTVVPLNPAQPVVFSLLSPSVVPILPYNRLRLKVLV